MRARQQYHNIVGIDKIRLAVAWRSAVIAGTTLCDASWRGNANESFVRAASPCEWLGPAPRHLDNSRGVQETADTCADRRSQCMYR